jgi:hypothetical protein
MNQSTTSEITSRASSKDNDGFHQEIPQREACRSDCSAAGTDFATSSSTSTDTGSYARRCTAADVDSNTSPTAQAAIAESYTEAGTEAWGLRLWKEEVK